MSIKFFKSLCTASLLILLVFNKALAQKTYTNKFFGFSITLPRNYVAQITEPSTGSGAVDGCYFMAIDSSAVKDAPYNYTNGLRVGGSESNTVIVGVSTTSLDKVGGTPMTLDKLSALPNQIWLARAGIDRTYWTFFNPIKVNKVFTTLDGLRALRIDCDAGNESDGVITKLRVHFVLKGKYMYAVRYSGTYVYKKNRDGQNLLVVRKTPVNFEEGFRILNTFRF